jgi:hypothetical protein
MRESAAGFGTPTGVATAGPRREIRVHPWPTPLLDLGIPQTVAVGPSAVQVTYHLSNAGREPGEHRR